MSDTGEAIAVVGLAARVPGAGDVEEYWRNLVAGRESRRVLSADALRARGVPAEVLDDPSYVRAAFMPPDAEHFDAGLFGMTAREAATCDPQIRHFLEVAHTAIEHAGYDPASFDAGVFASAGPPFYAEQHLLSNPAAPATAMSDVMTLNHGGYIATMASYKLNLRGPSVTVQTACSSTLVALHLACQALRVGDCDAAVVGGATVEFPFGHGYRWTPGGVRSRDGHCRPFDAAADGTVFGGGACAVVLKRLDDALADHDHVGAVIRASAVNNDGAGKVSFGAPSMAAQSAVVMEAMALAGVRPEEISYVEAHGTGTVLGDPIEVAALTDAYTRLTGGPLPAGSCAIGSVKGNIGHLGAVAGLAGLLKAVLALEREQLPPTANFAAPNPRLDLDATPFHVQDRADAWPRTPDRPRYAAVSSLGMGGTNAHVVLEEPPPQPYAAAAERPHVVVWSAPLTEAEPAVRARLGETFAGRGQQTFADAVATLQHGRAVHAVRAAALCATATDAADALGDPAGARIIGPRRSAGAARPVFMLFPGQGVQQVAMARGLHVQLPAYTAALDAWLERLDAPDLVLREHWQGSGDDIDDTAVAQSLLFAVEAALAELWDAVGVRPHAVLGHSIGELVAATVAGVFAPDDAATLVRARARAMRDAAAAGGMLAVAAGEHAVSDVLRGSVVVSVVNGPQQVVLSGTDDDLARAAAELAAAGVRTRSLRTSGAFHTPRLDAAAASVEDACAAVRCHVPDMAVISAATGRRLMPDEATDPAFWAGQLLRPVRFADALDALLTDADAVALEAGPSQVLTGLVRAHERVRSGACDAVASLPRRAGDDDNDVRTLLSAAAHVWTAGHDIEWATLGQPALRHRVPLPGYPYQRTRYWIDPPGAAARPIVVTTPPADAAEEATPPAADTTAAEHEDAGPFSTVRWLTAAEVPPVVPRRGTTAVVVLPNDATRALDVVLAVQQAGARVVRVRPGDAYGPTDDGYAVRAGVPDDLRRVCDDLAARGVRFDLVVHSGAAVPWPRTTTANVPRHLDDSFYAVLALMQRGLRPGTNGRLPRLLVLATGTVDVSGADHVEPVKASLHGAVRTLAAEVPWLSCRLVDASANTPVEALRDEVWRDDEPIVALRGRRRWVPRELPLQVAPADRQVVRPNGVYVLTGGLGGLGLETMLALAATGTRPRIALLGRTVPTPSTGEPAPSDDARSARVRAAVREAEAMGAEVRAIACDVGDARQLRRALDVVAAHYGAVHGVLHLAGVAGDGMLQTRTVEQAAAVLHPKVQGTYVLAEALEGRPAPELLVLFSSRAAVDGLVGSGDYAAANAVLDLFAQQHDQIAARVVSLAFPSWTTVGMASRTAAPTAGRTLRWRTTLDPEATWALDEHRINGLPILPAAAHVDMVVRAYRETVAGSDDAGIVLSDVTFHAPLTAVGARHVDVAFTPMGALHRWTVCSRPTGEPQAAWEEHASGGVARQAAEAGEVEVDALRARMSAAAVPGRNAAHRVLAVGPRWESVSALHVDGRQRVVDVRLPQAFCADLDAHPLHPALLDCATAAVRDDTDPPHVPFLYRRITMHTPLPAAFASVIRRRDASDGTIVADVDLVGPDDRVLVRVEGFTMRRVDPLTFGNGHAAAAHLAANADDAPETTADGPPDGAAAGTRRPVRGIDPDVGTDLLLTVLGARTPEHVVVRPYRDGSPVPLDGAPAGAGPPRVGRPDPAEPCDTAAASAGRTEPRAPGPAPSSADPGQAAPSTRAATMRDSAPTSPALAADAAPAGTAAETALVDHVRALWSGTLGIDDIGPDDDFFDLGGDSLSAVELMAQIRDAFDVELTIGFLFEAPTLAELTDLLEQQVTG